MTAHQELHLTAAFVHGMLVALHVLGIAYNVRRRNRFDVLMHVAASAYSIRSVAHHLRKEQEVT